MRWDTIGASREAQVSLGRFSFLGLLKAPARPGLSFALCVARGGKPWDIFKSRVPIDGVTGALEKSALGGWVQAQRDRARVVAFFLDDVGQLAFDDHALRSFHDHINEPWLSGWPTCSHYNRTWTFGSTSSRQRNAVKKRSTKCCVPYLSP